MNEERIITMLNSLEKKQAILVEDMEEVCLEHAKCSGRVTAKLEDFEKVLERQIARIEHLTNGQRKMYGMIMGISGTISFIVTVVILLAKRVIGG